MRLAVTVVLAAVFMTGCALRIQLNPAFAARAEELPMEVENGAAPLTYFRLGSYRVKRITLEQQEPACVELGLRICSGEYGPWQRTADIEAPRQPSRRLMCDGPPHEQRNGKPEWHAGVSFPMRCSIDSAAGTFQMDIDKRAAEPRLTFEEIQAGEPHVALAKTAAGGELRVVRILPPKGVFYNADMRGYYVRQGDVTLGAVETTPGVHRAWIARDMAPELRESVSFALLTMYAVNLP
jgi:hypothetical protein